MRITRQDCDAAWDEIGHDASIVAVAKHLNCAIETVRTKYTKPELAKIQTRKRRALNAKLLKKYAKIVRSYRLSRGKWPTAREAEAAGVTTYAMTRCGGWNKIMRAAGGTPRKAGWGSIRSKRR